MTNLIDPNRVRFGPYEVDLYTREIWKLGTRLKLVGQPFEILAVLVTRPGELVTRDALRERLWPGETFVDFNHGLNAAVNKLRDILCDSAEDPKYIETLPRRGYRFIAKVERGAQPEQPREVRQEPQSREYEAPAMAALLDQATQEQHPDHGVSRAFLGVMAGALLLVSFVAFFAVFGMHAKRGVDLDNAAAGSINATERILVSGEKNEGPQYSPDGKQLVFMSNRTGAMQLWSCGADGGAPKQITTMGDTGTPRWSPDGKTIAFDTRLHKYSAIMVVGSQGGAPRVLVASDANNSVPSWSHDGKYLYFASDRTGRYEVWRLILENGQQQEITQNGGFAPLESPDGATIYYTNNQFDHPEVMRVPRDGGMETQVSPILRPVTWAAWGPSGDGKGILFVEQSSNDVAMLSYLDLRTERLRQITLLGKYPFWLAVSPDGRRAAFDRADSEDESSLVELDGF